MPMTPAFTIAISEYQRLMLQCALDVALKNGAFDADQFRASNDELVSDLEEARLLKGMLEDMPKLQQDDPSMTHDFTA
jgi:hypothetical protein